MITPRRHFKKLIWFIDLINPFLVLLSIIGLFMEFSDLKIYVVTLNKLISIIFVIDFAIRILAYNPIEYLTKGYGWIDFLASLPGIFFFLNNTALFTIFKIIKVGRFFKIIRILRFLRVFSFLKKMKSDSVWIQDRIMKIGITVVMIFVVGIITIDNVVLKYITLIEYDSVNSEYNIENDIFELKKYRNDIVYYVNNKTIFNRDLAIVSDTSEIKNVIESEITNFLIIPLSNNIFTIEGNISLPETGLIINGDKITIFQNRVMLLLLTTLLLILIVIIFYMGFIFAKDMQIVQLIVDSFDADDSLLLNQKAEEYRDENGELIIMDNENEIISLLKASALQLSKNSKNNDDLLLDLAGIGIKNNNIDDIEKESNLLKIFNDKIDSLEINNRYLVEDTVKRLTPAIIKYIKKELKH